MGPFALADMVGIDIQHGVMELVFAQFYGEPAFAPMNLSALRVAGGCSAARPAPAGPLRRRQGRRCRPSRRTAGTAQVRVGAAERASTPTCKRR